MNAVSEIDALAATEDYRRLKAKLRDREWRLDNLYFIRNEEGEKTLFVRNEAQRAFDREMVLRNVLPKARKLGFSTFIAILICDRCVFRKGHVAGIIDRTIVDATDKLAMIRYAYLNMPGEIGAEIRRENPLVRDNDVYLEWLNGSSVSVGTSYRGGTPADLHVSEYGKISSDNPDAAKEIKTGAMQAVPSSGRIWVESTAHGTSGEFHDMVKRAEAAHLEGKPLTALDYKFHFYGWWIKREYRLQNNLVTISAELKKYFAKVEHKIGRMLDADQRAFYAKKQEELGPDDIKQEFPSTADELFFVSLAGAFWREELSKARRDKRIGYPVPYDPTRGVNTTWDIGEDCTAIIWHQSDGVRHRLIDYYEEEGGSLQRAAGIIEDKRRERKFVYLKHYGPHDFNERDWGNEGKTKKDTAGELGLEIEVVPRVQFKGTSIEAARRLLATTYIDEEHCSLLVTRLENYRKRWNKLMSVFTSDPVHDMASHGSDALQQISMALKPEKAEGEGSSRRGRRKGGQWAA